MTFQKLIFLWLLKQNKLSFLGPCFNTP